MAKLIGWLFIFCFIASIISAIIAVIVFIAAAVAVVFLVIGLIRAGVYVNDCRLEAKQDRDIARQAHNARLRRIANRAEREHKLYLAGDRRGIYGQYMPADPF